MNEWMGRVWYERKAGLLVVNGKMKARVSYEGEASFFLCQSLACRRGRFFVCFVWIFEECVGC